MEKTQTTIEMAVKTLRILINGCKSFVHINGCDIHYDGNGHISVTDTKQRHHYLTIGTSTDGSAVNFAVSFIATIIQAA